ncbi:hypothetical protein SARC_04065 [Sphaeroforma arctica JP610]|uniref:Hom-end-associated Hint domain-containing protein n=1 Tax=Sphaeroforma arctica JP610 TaxID=667725 RepID=A0A0L0G4G6_9EUKA|nr:hypothetical protein SARC_04065 [Sphaeroforma arctica JP610]KNC83706.1 hypothetical protein SARC_04065 [Sphaeroforma arctica JP610]|eukprot:XP_014157608.1 hypothetical protein SARC_04065 [Sphaeroforma arctica JP610]
MSNNNTLYLKEWDPETLSPKTNPSDPNAKNESYTEGSKVLICGRTGQGKCMAPETMVKMFTGEIKRLDQVVVGDRLLGPDERPRVVKTRVTGREQMYTVYQADSDPYVVTGDHKLALFDHGVSRVIIVPAIRVFDLQGNGNDTHEHTLYPTQTWDLDYTQLAISDADPWSRFGRLVRPTVNQGLQDPADFLKDALWSVRSTFSDCDIKMRAASISNIDPRHRALVLVILRLHCLACRVGDDGSISYFRIRRNCVGGIVHVTRNEALEEDYVGIQVSVDGLFCLCDNTVTHNSTIAKTLLYEKRDMFDSAFLFTGNPSTAVKDWSPIIPEVYHYVNEDVTPEALNDIVTHQQRANNTKRKDYFGGERHSKSFMAMVMDDLSGRRTFFDKLSGAFNYSRHYSMFMVVCTQQYTNISPEVRKSVNVIISTGADSVSERESLYREFFGFIPDKKVFYEILDYTASLPYTALVGDRDVKSTNWRDKIFYYRAKPVPDSFKLGSHQFWKMHYRMYNVNHDAQDDLPVISNMTGI